MISPSLEIEATCGCGASFRVAGSNANEGYVSNRYQDFLAAHSECRKAATPPSGSASSSLAEEVSQANGPAGEHDWRHFDMRNPERSY